MDLCSNGTFNGVYFRRQQAGWPNVNEMDQLYVEIDIRKNEKNDETDIYISVQSFLALYVFRYLGRPDNIQLKFVSGSSSRSVGDKKLKLRSETLRNELTDAQILCKDSSRSLQAIRDLRLPIYAKDSNTYIAGMCAVCRELVAGASIGGEHPDLRKLLGFKDGCLLAPAEASIWTKFCELDIIEATERLLQQHAMGEQLDAVPVEVPRFERHMNEPVRMHNIYKLAREQASASKQNKAKHAAKVHIDCSATPKEQLPIEHRFAEGIAFTIADLILYPCFRLIFLHCQGMLEHFPLIHTWLNEIDTFDPKCVKMLGELHTSDVGDGQPMQLKIPDCEAASLYKSDPKRYKPRNRIYTTQSELDASLEKLQTLQMSFSSESETTYNQGLDWNAIEPEQEKSSALPQERLLRKRQQLENLANAVMSLALPGERIIDFCSGTGHLGILLALQLPQCTVVLMENKAISLERAKGRATDLGLTNCRFYQCNIDYFEGDFDVGTALHACGTATDIVLQQCRRSNAKFVCCPCCYGSLQPMPHISYPLSDRFRTLLSEQEYMYLAHCADQAHSLGTLNCRPETTRQGQLCMDIVDTDRKLQAEEAGYEVVLTRLKPEECTPKNRLLVGRFVAASTR